jgi:hypothetical protein
LLGRFQGEGLECRALLSWLSMTKGMVIMAHPEEKPSRIDKRPDCRCPNHPARDTMKAKEGARVELGDDQLQALEASPQPPVVVDPRTGQEYLPIRREVYAKVQGFLNPFGEAWDNPAGDDLIRQEA